jgi:sarcosine oxidase subunit gamma
MMLTHAPLLPADARDDGPVTLTVDDSSARFSLRIAPADLAAASRAFGLALPTRIGDRATAGGRQALCLGPDEWVLHAPRSEREAIAAAFFDLSDGVPHSLVDVSDRERTIRLTGPKAADIIAIGCPIDLGRLAPGRGTRTVFDGVTVVLRRDGAEDFTLDAWRSFAPHVWEMLTLANRELAAGL